MALHENKKTLVKSGFQALACIPHLKLMRSVLKTPRNLTCFHWEW